MKKSEVAKIEVTKIEVAKIETEENNMIHSEERSL